MSKIDFDKMGGLVPAIIQDAVTLKVLMLGFMNGEAYKKTKKEGRVTFYSRTKNRLWTKGEESGNFLNVKEILEDCDNDTLLIKADPVGPVCHTGADTCFFEVNESGLSFLRQLQNLIAERKRDLPADSYTTKLFNAGINKIAQKVGEEAVELVIESKDSNDELFLNEAADLTYHLLVLLTQKGFDLADVVKILEQRHSK
jgi:phosphoribosyl-AMP cyclohydrolase / phosphoribosyl-ATP pyrophosphohydrolase